MTPTPADLPPPPASEPIPPDLLAWARQTFDADEFLQQVRQIEATGGCAFESFIAQVETRAGVS